MIEMENSAAYGTIMIELYSNIAPKMVARFKELAKDGTYDGVTWHRVNESVIQSGDPLSKDDDPAEDGTGNSNKPNVEAEFSDIPYDTALSVRHAGRTITRPIRSSLSRLNARRDSTIATRSSAR